MKQLIRVTNGTPNGEPDAAGLIAVDQLTGEVFISRVTPIGFTWGDPLAAGGPSAMPVVEQEFENDDSVTVGGEGVFGTNVRLRYYGNASDTTDLELYINLSNTDLTMVPSGSEFRVINFTPNPIRVFGTSDIRLPNANIRILPHGCVTFILDAVPSNGHHLHMQGNYETWLELA